ncbi:methyltransferase domain-containing protein [Gimesia fumaroli]|uniref:Arsenite methyltransferase n=1 Tax=Gimesia fumaroli TaxID=2527976 RepID=A0A518IAB9_9PLAN|nr:methyltransferase domain-containing protein [Gimesia fumaroli]QDV49979.1 arsenite S-adenosylmethyltransferase [Gimesia fumaroli]
MNSANTQARSTEEESVYSRYANAANQKEQALCCPVEYNPEYLSIIPDEILERDYGCGDPTPYLSAGDTVVDLGSGGGKICYIASQIVGPEGTVIGVDCNAEMLALARKYQQQVADQLGYSNIEFRCGLIQDLKLDLDQLNQELSANPIDNHDRWLEMRNLEEHLRRETPMIENNSVDCVISNCVLNLVREADRSQLLQEVFRVLKRGGKAVISDIVCDEDVPQQMREDPTLWSGCLSGAFREDAFLKAFEEAGFHGIQILKREETPWQTIQGIEFRSVTVSAYKGKQGPCLERNQAMIYQGPFKKVEDDDGHVYARGERIAVCDKTFQLLQAAPYQGQFFPIEAYQNIPLEEAQEMDCRRNAVRHPQETKGKNYDLTSQIMDSCCSPDSDCC